MPEKFTRWDPAEHIETAEDVLLYLEACAEECTRNGRLVQAGLQDIARSEGMRRLTDETGLTFEELHRAVVESGQPLIPAALRVVAELRAKAPAAYEGVERGPGGGG